MLVYSSERFMECYNFCLELQRVQQCRGSSEMVWIIDIVMRICRDWMTRADVHAYI